MFNKILHEHGFSDEQIKNLEKSMKENNIYLTGIEDAETAYKNLETKYNDVKGLLNSTTKAISKMKKDNYDNETLKERISEMENEMEKERLAATTKIKNMTVDSAINKLLNGIDKNHAELLSKAFDREKITVNDNGEISGINEQFKNIKEKYHDLFESKSVKLESATPVGANLTNSGDLSLEQQINKAMGIK